MGSKGRVTLRRNLEQSHHCLKLFQKSKVILVKQSDIIDIVDQHHQEFDAETGSKA
jgi:hypothetical protein